MKKRFSPAYLLSFSGWPLTSLAQPAVEPAVQPLPYDNVLNVIVGLCLVLALLFVAAWLVRRFQGVQGGDTRSIQLVSQLPLGVKEKILLLRVGDENILVGCTAQQIQALHVWQGPCPEPESGTGVASGAFASQLQQLLARGKKP